MSEPQVKIRNLYLAKSMSKLQSYCERIKWHEADLEATKCLDLAEKELHNGDEERAYLFYRLFFFKLDDIQWDIDDDLEHMAQNALKKHNALETKLCYRYSTEMTANVSKVKDLYMAESSLQLEHIVHGEKVERMGKLLDKLSELINNQIPMDENTKLKCSESAKMVFEKAKAAEEYGDEEQAYIHYSCYCILFDVYEMAIRYGNSLSDREMLSLKSPTAPLSLQRSRYCQENTWALSDSLDNRYERIEYRKNKIKKVKSAQQREKQLQAENRAKASNRLVEMHQRKEVKMTRKMSKSVRDVIVTEGDVENYNIDEVLKSLGEDEPKENSKAQKRKKKKSKQKEINSSANDIESSVLVDSIAELNIGSTPTTDPVLEEQERLALHTPSLQTSTSPGTKKRQMEQRITNDNNNEIEEECSICYNPRTKTFLFFPCGHATFCEICANRIFNDLKKCPTCQNPIQGICPVFH